MANEWLLRAPPIPIGRPRNTLRQRGSKRQLHNIDRLNAINEHSTAVSVPRGCVLHAAFCGELLNECGLCTRADVLLSLIGACTGGAEFDSGGVFSFLIILQLRDPLSPSAQGSAAWNDAWETWGWPGSGRPPTPGSQTTSWPFRTREGGGGAEFPRASDERSLGSMSLSSFSGFKETWPSHPPPSSRPLISD